MITYSAAEWEYLPRKGFPMIFHGVQGKEDTDQFSPRYAALSNICQAVYVILEICAFTATSTSPKWLRL